MTSSMATASSARASVNFVRRFVSRGGHLWPTSAYLTDQAVCSAGNFFTSFLAARSLSADQFSVFALLNIVLISA